MTLRVSFQNTKKIVRDNIFTEYSLEQGSDFFKDLKTAGEVDFVSPFYNIAFLIKLKAILKISCKVRAVFVKEQSLKKSVKQIRDLENFNDKRFSIYFIDSPYLLHTKMYNLKIGRGSTKVSRIYLGSSNASTHSIEQCEELMIRLDYSGKLNSAFDTYFEQVLGKSINSSNSQIEIQSKSIESFFNQGRLYTKTGEIFAPTIEIDFGKDHKEVLQQLQANIPNNIFVRASANMSILKLIKHEDLSTAEEGRSSQRIKMYGLYTSLGLWVPDGYEYHVNKILEDSKASRKRKSKLDSIRAYIVANNKLIVKYFEEILGDVADAVSKNRDTFLTKDNYAKLDKKLNWCLDRLEERADNYFYKSLVSPFFSSPMPRIWEDEFAVKDFYEYFLFSFQSESGKKKTQNKLYNSIKQFHQVKFGKNMDVDITNLLTKEKEKGKRVFQQTDLVDFLKLNKGNPDYKITPFSNHKASKGEVAYFDEYTSLVRGNLLIYGVVQEVINGSPQSIQCGFEDDDFDYYSQKENDIYFVKRR